MSSADNQAGSLLYHALTPLNRKYFYDHSSRYEINRSEYGNRGLARSAESAIFAPMILLKY